MRPLVPSAQVDARSAVNEKPPGRQNSAPHSTWIALPCTDQSSRWRPPPRSKVSTDQAYVQSSMNGVSRSGASSSSGTVAASAIARQSHRAWRADAVADEAGGSVNPSGPQSADATA